MVLICEISNLQVGPPCIQTWSRTETGFQTDWGYPEQPRWAPALWPWWFTGFDAQKSALCLRKRSS